MKSIRTPETQSYDRTLTVGRACIYDLNGRILLLQRSAENSRNVGLWEFPGGKKKPDETVAESFSRELAKETGLSIFPMAHFTEASERNIHDGKYAGFVYKSYFAFIRVNDTEITLSPEHQAYAWAYYQDVMDYDLTIDTRDALTNLRPLIEQPYIMEGTG